MVKRLSIVIPGLAAFLLFAPDAALGKVSSQCARLAPTGGREVIINACSTCVIVNITRKRPGIPAPVARSFNLQPKSSIQVPFRGPGRSRITSVIPCKGEKGAAPNLADEKPLNRKDKKCVALENGKTGQVALVNSCQVCKAVLIERQNKSGKGKRQAYKVGPKSILPIQPKGATGVGLLAEINCPK
ncbi:MAG: hypothetical protein O3B76_03875 [Proteobacteria bacterium]|nr:hypothetical protein [Pseudomonadota bacterium]MDA1022699.1 hypothetical protein [Pseudomonadota bacterium]